MAPPVELILSAGRFQTSARNLGAFTPTRSFAPCGPAVGCALASATAT